MRKLSKKLLRRFEVLEVEATPIPSEQVLALQQRWRHVFAAELHARTGEWTHNGFDWHVFSFEYRTSLSGDEALGQYRQLRPCSCLVLSSCLSQTELGFRCEGKPPDLSGMNLDVSVVAADFAWTMCFTHETAFGPYLSFKASSSP